jgi:signal transduction histidine kinase
VVYDSLVRKWFLKVTVKDTGVGIPLDVQPKLFKLFGTVSHSGQQNSSGIGLGLVICRSIVEANGGKIDFESEEGKGSKFFFTFEIGNLDLPIDENDINISIDFEDEFKELSDVEDEGNFGF